MKLTLRYMALMFAIGLLSTATSTAQWPGGSSSSSVAPYGSANGNYGMSGQSTAGYANYPSTGYNQSFGSSPCGPGGCGNANLYASGYGAAATTPATGYPSTSYPSNGYAATSPYSSGGYAAGTSSMGGAYAGAARSQVYMTQTQAGSSMPTNPGGTTSVPGAVVPRPMASGADYPQGTLSSPTANATAAVDPSCCNGGPWSNTSWCAEPVVPVGPTCCRPKWFGGVYGLVWDRRDTNSDTYIIDPTVTNCSCLNARDAEMDYSGGFEFRLGRAFGSGTWGIEYIFWQLYPDAQRAEASAAGGLTGAILYEDVYLPQSGGSDTAYNLFTNGNIIAARLDRDYNFRNIEINFLRRSLFGGCGGGACGAGGCGTGACGAGAGGRAGCGLPSRLHIGCVCGVRYFRFDESWLLSYDNADTVFDGLDPDSEFGHYVAVENDLIGAQLGLNCDYFLTRCLQLEFGSKFGLFGNRMTHVQQVFDGNGFGYVIPAAPEDVHIRTDASDISFLGELRFGLAYQLCCNCRVAGGYRALAASNVAVATNQLPVGRAYTDLTGLDYIDRDASLVLHGAYLGLEFAW